MSHPKTNNKARQNSHKPEKPRIPITELLAIEATKGSRQLLHNHGMKDETTFDGLELALAHLYANAKDQVEMEQEMAAIHPHRDFILKYHPCPPCAPIPPKTKTTVTIPEFAAPFNGESQSNCEGNPNCNCDKVSNFDNDGKQTILVEQPIIEMMSAHEKKHHKGRISTGEIIGITVLVGIVATAIVIIHHTNRKYK